MSEDNTVKGKEISDKEITQEDHTFSYPTELTYSQTDVKMPISKKLYHNENLPSFFRRLTFTPDGALLLTCAGLFHDQHSLSTSHSIYIYARSNFSR